MDLDDFESAAAARPASLPSTPLSAAEALEYLDGQWYTLANRRGRWMDLIGDYAGSETFVLDGDALLQHVLRDPLLALGRVNEPSFQLLHALYSLERILNKFKKREAVFEIVFWQDNRHLTIQSTPSDFVITSRMLARALLFKHLRRLDIPVHTFKDLSDPKWLRYRAVSKPMFVMTNDGGVLDDQNLAGQILTQRIFIFDLLSQGTSVTLLQGTEFRDSKIMSFIYEQRLDRSARSRLDDRLWAASHAAMRSLEAKEKHARHDIPLIPLISITPQSLQSTSSQESAVRNFVRNMLSAQGLRRPFIRQLVFAFAAHLLILPLLSVEERARPLAALHPELIDILLSTFLPSAFLTLEDVWSQVAAEIDVDGRVFLTLIEFIVKQPDVSFTVILGPEVYQRLTAIWSSLDLAPVHYVAFSSRFASNHLPQDVSLSQAPASSLLPFTHPLFSDELVSVDVHVEEHAEALVLPHLEFNTVFNDIYHWHNPKLKAILPTHLGGEDSKPLDEWQRRRQLRRDQRFMTRLQWQAETLTGALGVPLKQMVIPLVGRLPSKLSSNTGPRLIQEKPSKSIKKGKVERVSAAEKIRQENMAKKQLKEDESNLSWWQEQLGVMARKTTDQSIILMENYERNKRAAVGWLAVEMRLFRLHLEFMRWIDHPDRENAAIRDNASVLIMRKVKEIYERQGLFPAALKALASALSALGFSHIVPSLSSASPDDSSVDRSLNFKFIKLLKSKSGSPIYKFMRIGEDPIVWQLRLFGEFMDRSMDSASDARVPFRPDAWQRKVLDCLDENQSVLVVAPTSAGKTFISYYAMEKILRTSDDGILIYVAPTKALVNQIAAEVYARFKKELNGGSCWAIHTRDYRVHNPQKCQILVTVPEMLAIMLLSPPLARVWTPRIKYIILDEIHSIGQQQGGAVWEQIILLAPCPIIGLSATIGHPEQFNTWLQSVQEAHKFQHTFIHHPHRYSHLRKHTYALQIKSPTSFSGLTKHSNTGRLRFLHPISMLAFGVQDLPPDLSLEASDCLSLYQAFMSCSNRASLDLATLEPTRFFSDSSERLLKQSDILRYESALKADISKLMMSADSQHPSFVLNDVIDQLTDPVLKNLDHQFIPSVKDFYSNLIYLVSDLHATGDLPAIFFHFDRKACELMGQVLLEMLESAETNWRESSPEWIQKINQWEHWKSQAKARERQAERLNKQKKDPNDHVDGVDLSWESSFDPLEPSPQFSFTGVSSGYSKSDIEKEITDLARWAHVQEWALKAMRRGVGVHHSGMNKQYRTLVESLYRAGYLRVVIATGSLALGINAPTKTSVFCGDSPFLTALMYRQCAGRAGRRGYDLLGKVVFYGIAMDRCQRLVLSRLPSLGGNFPLTSTMVLRLFNLLQGSDNAPFARDAIHSLLQLPHVSFTSNIGREQVLHHIRFSIDYLRRSGLLDHQGNPINLFGIAAHLYYTEPSNFALVALLRHGVIHRICAQSSQDRACRDLLLLMCHLFGRRYLPKSYTTDKNLQYLIKKSPSMVVLPPLPADAKRVLIEHDTNTLRIFSGYAVAYSTQHAAELGSDSRLPLSKREYHPCSKSNSLFCDYLNATAVKVTARSLFVANSGHCDSFQTVEELTRTARTGLHLNEYAIPSMHRFTASAGDAGEVFALNAYLLDFYTHGQTAALTAANGIREGEVWYLLDDFVLTLKTIRAGLVQLLLKASKTVVDASTDETEELDSGYDSYDPAEVDGDEGDVQASPSLERPRGVSDEDWKVYEVMDAVTNEFDEKFKAMWA